ncbi:DUF6089 family protein [Sphingobacterium sp. LRF_L2]|uniref:type IX secretion system protein PorG n=1 Tax=Sphingobacterium sp. LRF_L2 TaxID=3369421 RepID=UPI003F63A364
MKHLVYILIVVLWSRFPIAQAQQWEIGGNVGTTGFMGDINPNNPFYFKSIGAGIHVVHNFNPTWGVQASYQYAHLTGSDLDDTDDYRRQRGQMFNNHVSELSVRANFNFFRFIAGRNVNKYTPYLFAGIAGIKHNPYAFTENGTKHSLEDLQLQEDNTVKKFAFAIPFGVGFKYNVRGPWSIGAELGYRIALNDNLDNIANNYPYADQYPINYQNTYKELTEEWWKSIAFPSVESVSDYEGKPKGNGRPHDGYMLAGITVTFTFISKKCYWWN